MKTHFSVLFLVLLVAGCSTRQQRGLPTPGSLEVSGAELLDQGRAVEAKELFLQALVEPRSNRFLAAIGLTRANIALKLWTAHEQSLRLALSSMPDTPEASDLVARTMLEAARVQTGERARLSASMAATFFARVRAQAHDIPGLSYHVGLCKVIQGRTREAVPYFEQSLRESPRTKEALDALVYALRELKAAKRLVGLLEPLEKDGTLPPALAKHLVWARAQALRQ